MPVRAGCLCPACVLLLPPLLGVLRLGEGLPGDDDLEAEGGAAPYFSSSCCVELYLVAALNFSIAVSL